MSQYVKERNKSSTNVATSKPAFDTFQGRAVIDVIFATENSLHYYAILDADSHLNIPHLPVEAPRPQYWNLPLTTRYPLYPGYVYWIGGDVTNYNQDLKVYVIAGGDGTYSPSMKAAVLEVRANHDQDLISYGSLSHWGGKWNYADSTDNPIRRSKHFEIRLKFTDFAIVVWVNDRMMSIYPYSTTIGSIHEITGIHIPAGPGVTIKRNAIIQYSGNFYHYPVLGVFNPPISYEVQWFYLSGYFTCGYGHVNTLQIVFHNGQFPSNIHFAVKYVCNIEQFSTFAVVNGQYTSDSQTQHFPRRDLSAGLTMFADIRLGHATVNNNYRKL
ncbi:hypothetical protein DdX_20817 [Ditylenchus destructor]|uniref:Galectin n=1 Tax=Ditylenchus destructor TaxID=166010 RepID=A0AAD4MFP9_9BILA|nr:hypothetical protein DdX_20817 [Ditylenchus destructor]